MIIRHLFIHLLAAKSGYNSLQTFNVACDDERVEMCFCEDPK